MTSWLTASRDAARVFFIANQHVAVVIGRKPQHCGEVEILRAEEHEAAPVFSIGGWHDSRATEYATDLYYLVKPLLPGPALPHIDLYHRDGRDRLVVEVLNTRENAMAPPKFPAVRAPISGISPLSQRSAIGFSQDFSFDEAFSDALRALPSMQGNAPTLIDVVAMGAVCGGISGFSRMFVKVEPREIAGDDGERPARSSAVAQRSIRRIR